jgi:hypothetical protein
MAKGNIRALVGVSTLLGSIIVRAAVVQAQATPSNYLPIDPAQVECTAFRPASNELCYKIAVEPLDQ